MYRLILILLLAVGAHANWAAEASDRETRARVPKAVLPRHVQIDDSFWAPKLEVYRKKTIPHSWQYVQREIEDNEIAAHWRSAERGKDTPWNQANLHKVLETCAYALGSSCDLSLDRKVDDIVAAIAGAQQPNGYVNALVTVRGMTPWANLDGQHDGYVAGHLIEAAVAHYEATGKTNLLCVAEKLANHIYQTFITEKKEGVCGHAELELALVRLYRATGERKYLELAKNWIERRGKPWQYTTDTVRSYFMDHVSVREADEITGHAVRSMFYATSVADVAAETGDPGMSNAAQRLWRSTTQRKMYVTGSVGSQKKDEGFGPDYDLPHDGYAESCAACGLIYFSESMFRLERSSESIDVLERALYNAVLHGIALDGTHTYYCNPLSDANRPRDNVWVCCPPCLSRTLMRLPEYIYAQTDTNVYVNLYVGSSARIVLQNGPVGIQIKTGYPWDGKVRMKVTPHKSGQVFNLRLRIPGWATVPQLMVNGHPTVSPKQESGYMVISRKWSAGDCLDFELAMPVKQVLSNPKVVANRDRVTLQRGPIVYGIESVDNPGNPDPSLAGTEKFELEYRPQLLGGITVIRASAEGRPVLTAIPFYSLANRGPSAQQVWLKLPEGYVPALSWGGKLYE